MHPSLEECLLRRTFELSLRSREKGNHPFGALLFLKNAIVLEAENTVVIDRDFTHHAELNLVSRASRELDDAAISECVLFSSAEPCAMCCGAIYWAGICSVVFGLSGKKLGSLAKEAFVIPSRQLLNSGSRRVSVKGPFLEKEAVNVHEGFWGNRENKSNAISFASAEKHLSEAQTPPQDRNL